VLAAVAIVRISGAPPVLTGQNLPAEPGAAMAEREVK